jgi:hypothetical protein
MKLDLPQSQQRLATMNIGVKGGETSKQAAATSSIAPIELLAGHPGGGLSVEEVNKNRDWKNWRERARLYRSRSSWFEDHEKRGTQNHEKQALKNGHTGGPRGSGRTNRHLKKAIRSLGTATVQIEADYPGFQHVRILLSRVSYRGLDN